MFMLLYTCNTNRGLMDIYVDNIKVATLNQYSASLTWHCTWNSPTYNYGGHSVRFVNVSANSNYTVDVDAVIIPAIALTPTTVSPSDTIEPTLTPTQTPTP
jgi:hypothetical protein